LNEELEEELEEEDRGKEGVEGGDDLRIHLFFVIGCVLDVGILNVEIVWKGRMICGC
jgi:hypothetical protein